MSVLRNLSRSLIVRRIPNVTKQTSICLIEPKDTVSPTPCILQNRSFVTKTLENDGIFKKVLKKVGFAENSKS
uniref:Uncharacterized protein n=1 Tax=Megaselia scalaris TaxID=36166 RepID=T1GZB4_MEGSC